VTGPFAALRGHSRAGRTKPKRDAEATKKRLLDAAETEFANKGFAGARLGAIAAAAAAQQALVHHYFGDKEGLYAAVLTRAVEATTSEGWGILQGIPAAAPRGKKRAKGLDLPALRALTDAFAASLLRFFATHAALLSIVRHDARAGGELTRELVTRTSKPMFDIVVAMMEDLARRGVVRRDIDVRQLCVSVFAMCAYPYYDEEFLTLLWPVDIRSAEFMDARRREIVETAMARLTPSR